MQDYRSVAVIIVNWNNRRATGSCIRSLQHLMYTNFNIIIVDNGSTDDSIACLTRQYPEITVIGLNRNTGFAHGANVGIRHALGLSADFLWILNNDALVTPNSLSALVNCMDRDNSIGMAGSVLVEWTNGHRTEVRGGRVNFFTGLSTNDPKKTTTDRVDYIKGASILLRSEAVDSVGCFDESFFLYWEDTDLGFRMRSQGWKLCVAEDSVIIHDGHGSMMFKSPEWDYHFTRSSMFFFLKHARFPLLPIAVSVTGRLIMRLIRGQWPNAAALMKAVFVIVFPSTPYRAPCFAKKAGDEK